ncbi:AAA ATPase [Irineochytrium annulatum]|nr:AAA ATPase [Irineochytrium annulatum]
MVTSTSPSKKRRRSGPALEDLAGAADSLKPGDQQSAEADDLFIDLSEEADEDLLSGKENVLPAPVSVGRKRGRENTFPEPIVIGTPSTSAKANPVTPTSASSRPGIKTPSSVYKDAKFYFRPASTPSRLVGREKERHKLTSFLRGSALEGRPGALYVSGCPGTGKTALVDEVLNDLRDQIAQMDTDVEICKLNCMGITDMKKAYAKMCETFDIDFEDIDACTALEERFTNPKGGRSFILILDEIDHLMTRDQKVLYRIFEWPILPGSSVTLIGIANALDLLDRHLPHLTKRKCAPEILNFKPYETAEIAEIIKGRLRDMEAVLESPMSMDQDENNILPRTTADPKVIPVINAAAIELCARKVSATGDLRRALDVCRQSIELAEQDMLKVAGAAGKTPLKSLQNSCNKIPSPSPKLRQGAASLDLKSPVASIYDVPRVTVSHVLRASASVTGSGPVQRVERMNSQQKAVLVALMLLGTAGKGSEMMIGKLHESYTNLCGKRKLLTPVSRSEFGDILSLLETTGMIQIGKAREERARKVELSVLPSQVEKGIESDSLLRDMFVKGMAAAKQW